MQNGELERYKAKLIVMMLGTNNINRNPNDEIVDGDRLIVEEFKKRQPQAKVLMLGIFPRAAWASDPYRASIKEINGKLAKLADSKQAFFMDIGEKFLASDGTLTPEIMPDGLHPNLRGYKIWADAISARVKELMNKISGGSMRVPTRSLSVLVSSLIGLLVGGSVESHEARSQNSPRPVIATAADFQRAMKELSNWGRWGDKDELGAANLITPAKRKQALALAKEGLTVSLAHDVVQEKAVDAPTILDRVVVNVSPERRVWTVTNTAAPIMA